MNRYGFNRSALNGVVYALVLASASMSCAASVTAVATRQADALASGTSGASLIANAQVTRYVSAVFEGVGGLYPQATHTQAGSSTLQGNAQVTAYVLREVTANATVYGTCELTVIAASALGYAQIAGTAGVTANATRVQAARSNAQGVCEVALSVAPTIYRMALVQIQATAALRGETSIWQIAAPYTLHSAYGVLDSVATVTAASLLTRPASIALSGHATVLGIGNAIRPGYALMPCGAEVTAEALTQAMTGSLIRFGTATVTATATRTVNSAALLTTGTCTFTGQTKQNHAARALTTGTGVLLAQPYITQYLRASLLAGSSVTATGLKTLKPQAVFAGSANLTLIEPQITSVIRLAQADIVGTFELIAEGRHLRLATALLGGTAEILADTISNADSIDPQERTFFSPARITEFVRPFIETEFRRAA